MDLRQLYRWTGVCAVVMAILVVVYCVIFVSANGFTGMSSAQPTPDQIIKMAQAQGNQINASLDLVSYFFYIPALVGMFAFLWGRTPARACIGAAFVAFTIVCFSASSVLGSFVLEQARGTVTEALKERLSLLSGVAYSFMMVGLFAGNLANLLWGLAFRSQAGLSRAVGYLLLAGVVVFLVMVGLAAGGLDSLFNVGFLLSNLIVAVMLATAGALLWKTAKAS